MTRTSISINSATDAKVAFIIPARNEENMLPRTLSAIKEHACQYAPQIVVIDHDSTDKTDAVARHAGAIVLNKKGGSIGAARNTGVANVSANILVFLDADVQLTSQWAVTSNEIFESLQSDPNQVLGSRCQTDDHNGFVSNYWFDRLTSQKSGYVNSGHMITSFSFFEQLGGFDANKRTGEDHDICMRAIQLGGKVRNCPELKVVHAGYPQTVFGFMRRECWHGSDDVISKSSFLSSRTAWMAAAYLATFVLTMLVVLATRSWMPLITYGLALFVAMVILTVLKFGFGSLMTTICSAILFFAYLNGRAAAIVARFFGVTGTSGSPRTRRVEK